MSVVVIGDALIDEMRDPAGSVDAPGGSALNVAVGLAILGVPSALVAMVGSDSDGFTLSRHLDEHGVELFASPAPRGTGRAISDRTDGEPRYSFSQAQVERRIDFHSASAAIALSELVAVSGFPFDDADQVETLRAAVSGRRVFIDPNPRPGLLHDRRRFARALEDLAAESTLIKVGEDDARLIWELPVRTVALHLLDAGATAVLATTGPDGATLFTTDAEIHRPIVSLPTPVVDTMGAGDATFAAVIAQAMQGVPSEEALDFAMAIAAETIRWPGGLLRTPVR